MISLSHVSYFAPPDRIFIEESYEHFNITPAQAKVFSKIYGLESVPIAKEIKIADLICAPIQQLLEQSNINPCNVKYLIHAHTAKVIASFDRSIVQEVKAKLGLSHALAFGTTLNNCASVLNALEIADMLLFDQNEHECAIVVTGELAFTPVTQIIPNTSIMGDSAAAALIHKGKQKNLLVNMQFFIDGRFSKGVWLSEDEGKIFELAYSKNLSAVITAAVKNSNLQLSDIKIILPHNVNLISWDRVAACLKFDKSRIYLKNVRRYGHCFGADIMINYVDAYNENLIQPGDYFMMVTVGLGATFAAAVFRH